MLVDDQEGSVGQYSGWRVEGSLHSSAEKVDQTKHAKSRGGKGDNADQSIPSPPRVVNSKALKSTDEQVAGRRGKRRATRQDDPEEQGKATRGHDPKGKGKATRGDDPKGKGKATRGDDSKGRSASKMTPRTDSGSDNPLRPSRRVQKKLSDVYEKDTGSQAEFPPGDNRDALSDHLGGEEGEDTIEEGENSGETGRPTSKPDLAMACWHSFMDSVGTMETEKCDSIDEWVEIAVKAVKDHGRKLRSMEKQ